MKDQEVQVIVFPRGQLSAKDKERLTRNGVVAVEADDPQKVQAIPISMPQPVSTNAMFYAAIQAIKASKLDGVARDFVCYLADLTLKPEL